MKTQMILLLVAVAASGGCASGTRLVAAPAVPTPLQSLVGQHVLVSLNLPPVTTAGSRSDSVAGTVCQITDGWLVLAQDEYIDSHIYPTSVPNRWLSTAYIRSVSPSKISP